MSPLDNELRRTLTQHASDLDPSLDLWAQVEQRARTMHRRRLATAGVVGSAVVAAVIVVGVSVTGGSQADRLVPTNPSPTSTQVAPSPTSAPTRPSSDGAVTGWPMIGKNPAWVRWDAVLQSMPAQMPPDFAPLGAPHVIATADTDGGPVVVFVVPAGDHLVAAAVLQSAPGSAVAVHDIQPDGNVPYVGVVVRASSSGGIVDDGVVVGAPATGQIEFRLPGEPNFRAVEGGVDPRVATVTLGQVTPGEPVAQVRVLDGDGNTDKPLYTGPIQVGLTFPDV